MRIPAIETTSRCVHWVNEAVKEDGELTFSETGRYLRVQEWDVGDPEALAAAARLELGPVPDHVPAEWYETHANWFVDKNRNAAALVVFREPTGRAVRAWQIATSKPRQ